MNLIYVITHKGISLESYTDFDTCIDRLMEVSRNDAEFSWFPCPVDKNNIKVKTKE